MSETRPQARRFEEGDSIRAHLGERGVHVNDRDNRWHTADGRHGSIEPFSVEPRREQWGTYS